MSHLKRRGALLSTTLSLGAIGFTASDSLALTYARVTIAQPGAQFIDFGPFGGRPTIDGSGRVYFTANTPGGLSPWEDGVFAGSGGAVTTVYGQSTAVFFPGNAVSSPGGMLAFTTLESGFRVRRGNGGPSAVVFTLADPYDSMTGGQVNDAGLVTLAARRTTTAAYEVLRGSSAGNFEIMNAPAVGFSNVQSINAAGNTLWTNDPNSDGRADFIFSRAVGGTTRTRVSAAAAGLQFVHTAALDDGDRLTFAGRRLDGSDAIFRETSPNTFATLLDSSAEFAEFGAVYANNRGDVAFQASLDTGLFGIWVRDAAGDVAPVIVKGETVGDSTVNYMTLSGFNDAGQVTYSAALNNGTPFVFRSDPVPEPACASMVVALTGICARRRRRAPSATRAQRTISVPMPASV